MTKIAVKIWRKRGNRGRKDKGKYQEQWRKEVSATQIMKFSSDNNYRLVQRCK